MIQIISHTPIWVFILFLVLVIFGFLQTRSREVKFIASFILPTGMVILSFVGVLSSFGFEFLPVMLWGLGVLALSFIGYKIIPLKGVVYHFERGVFSIPGSWLSFIVVMAIFFTKYSVAVMKATNVSLVHNFTFILILCLAYGAFSGFFVSRAIGLVIAKKGHI